jgi:hypothetical protein
MARDVGNSALIGSDRPGDKIDTVMQRIENIDPWSVPMQALFFIASFQ